MNLYIPTSRCDYITHRLTITARSRSVLAGHRGNRCLKTESSAYAEYMGHRRRVRFMLLANRPQVHVLLLYATMVKWEVAGFRRIHALGLLAGLPGGGSGQAPDEGGDSFLALPTIRATSSRLASSITMAKVSVGSSAGSSGNVWVRHTRIASCKLAKHASKPSFGSNFSSIDTAVCIGSTSRSEGACCLSLAKGRAVLVASAGANRQTRASPSPCRRPVPRPVRPAR